MPQKTARTDYRELTVDELDVVGGVSSCEDPIRSLFRPVIWMRELNCLFDPLACQC